RITDAKSPVHGDVTLDAPPPHARWEGATTVTVSADVVPVLGERKLAAIAILVTGAQRLDAHLEPATADVVLRGPAESLAAVTVGSPSLLVDAAAEDAKPPAAYRKRISVVGLPTGVAAEVRPEAVTLVTRRRRE